MNVLRISTAYTRLESSIYNISRMIPEITDYYLFEPGDSGPDLDQFDAIWCYTSNLFTREAYPEFYEKLDNYKGRTINYRCAEKLSQEIMTRTWIDNGIKAPEFVKFSSYSPDNINQLPEGWNYPLMVKACREYPRVSFARIINNDNEYEKWYNTHSEFDHILQEYLPFDSSDQMYYCGQLYIVGDEMFPRTTRWTNHWYVSPTDRGRPHLGLEVGGFTSFPGFSSNESIYEQARHICDLVDVDLGTLDFSLTDDGEVIPWGICTVYPFYTEGSDVKDNPDYPSAIDQVYPQTQNWNVTLSYLGIDRKVTDNQIWRIIRACELNL